MLFALNLAGIGKAVPHPNSLLHFLFLTKFLTELVLHKLHVHLLFLVPLLVLPHNVHYFLVLQREYLPVYHSHMALVPNRLLGVSGILVVCLEIVQLGLQQVKVTNCIGNLVRLLKEMNPLSAQGIQIDDILAILLRCVRL